MERNLQKNGLLNLVALVVAAVTGYVVARTTGSLAGQLSVVFLALGALVSAVSWFQMRLETNEQLEKLEVEELAKSRGASTLFESKEAELFPAQRSREQFERFFVPVFTAILCVAQAIGAFFLWRWLAHNESVADLKQPTVALALFALLALLLFLLGKFSATIARLENHRLLRPGASWLLLGAYLCFFVALGTVAVQAGLARADFQVARVLCVLLGLVALETLVNLLLDIYRPRVKGRIERPLYESRLVGLLGHPEGLITTAAQALDYQFGFKVSETWFFRLVRDWLPVLILAQLGVLLLSTCLVFIDPGEQGLIEHFGRRPETGALLNPGPHLKWPWPIDKVYRYRTDQIQSFNVGFTPDPRFEDAPVVLWKIQHSQEENFLVANRENSPVVTNAAGGRPAPPVSLLTVSIPVQFQITNLIGWVYNNANPTDLLQDVATREVVHYLVGADINEIMSRERQAAGETLRQRIQNAANDRRLGVNIVFVGLQDIHPPVKVAEEYEKVIGASQKRLARILAAQADDIRTNALAAATAYSLISQAMAERKTREIAAWAQAALFTNQIPAYQAAPSVYAERAYLQAFARATANARKYIVLTSNSQDVVQYDLQDKIREDLLNLNVKSEK